MKFLIYALGSGVGHVIRALAILQAIDHLKQLDSTDMIVSSPLSQKIRPYFPSQVKIHQLLNLSIAQRKKGLTKIIVNLLDSIPYDVVLVDTFPFGLYQELPKIWNQQTHSSRPQWIYLFRRLLVPLEKEIFTAIANDQLPYHEIIVPNTPNLRSFSHIPPAEWEICKSKVNFHWVGQIITNSSLFEKIGDNSEKILSKNPIICHTGARYECEILERKLRELKPSGFNFNTHYFENFQFPLFPQLKTAVWACGGTGYNFTNEIAALGKPTFLFPFPREYDDQVSRLKIYNTRYPYLIPLEDPNGWKKLHIFLEKPPKIPPKNDFTGATQLAKFLVKIV